MERIKTYSIPGMNSTVANMVLPKAGFDNIDWADRCIEHL